MREERAGIYSRRKHDQVVLVGVLKTKRDFSILMRERWYRIPVAHAPVRRFRYIAFYQPASFGREGKQIRYYAPVVRSRLIQRSELFPDEPRHIRAYEYYLQIHVGVVKELLQPIRNRMPRRVSFGFTTMKRLLSARNILELYDVAPTEQILERGLHRAGIAAFPQYFVRVGGYRYRLDFAVFCKRGPIAIECDNKKAHSGLEQRKKDKEKSTSLKRHGWTVIRFPERDIVSSTRECVARVRRAVEFLGGTSGTNSFRF